MSSNEHPILSRLVAVPSTEHARSVQVSAHVATHDAYRALRDEHHGEEYSAGGGDYWHRWTYFGIDGVEYVIHDPVHYDADPLGPEKRLAELQEMLAAVLADTTMPPAEKVSEIARLAERIADHIVEQEGASYPDGTTDETTRAFDVLADAAAAPGVEG